MADMKLNKKLNLVYHVQMTNGATGIVHIVPVSLEVFEANFLTMSKALSAIYSAGIGHTMGPRVAAMMLRRISTQDVPPGVTPPSPTSAEVIMAAILQRSNLLVPNGAGYEYMPLQEAKDKSLIDEESYSELENALVFFTLASVGFNSENRAQAVKTMCALWETETTPLPFMEFLTSLRTLTETDSSTKVAGSSVPS